MKKRFTFLMAAVMLLGMMVQPLTAVGQTRGDYTITFGNNASSATAISTSTNASTVISSGTSYVTSKPFTVNSGNCYYGDTKTCIRIGKSGADSELVISLSDDGKVKATSIVVNCNKMTGNKNDNATVAVNGMDAQSPANSSSDPTDLTFTFDTPTDIENITLTGSKASRIYYITVNYTTTPVGATIYATPASLSDFSYLQGNGPSEPAKTFTVSGTNLTANLVATASSNYELCKTSDGTYATSVEYEPASGTVTAQTVYVRLKAGLAAGTQNGSITVSSTGASDQEITLTGSVAATHTLSYSAEHGSITGESGSTSVASGASLGEGSTVTLTATPSEGYKFSEWSVSGTGSTLSSTTANPTTFTMGTANATVTAAFVARTPATITWHEGNGGNTSTTTNTYADATVGDRTPVSVNGWTALGWATNETATSQTAPAMVSSSTVVDDIDNASHHVDLYAVYTKGSNTFELVNSVTSGETYVICAVYSSNYYVLTNEDGNYMTKASVSVSSNSFNYTVGRKFVLSGDNTNGFTFYDGSEYLTGNSSSVNNLTLGELTDYGKWSISFDNTSNVASIKNKQNTSYYVSYYGNKGYFNCHTTPNTLYLFKQTSNDLNYTTAPTSEKCQVTYTANTGVGDDLIDDNGGSKYDVGATITVWANEGTGKPNFTKEHYQFINWNTAADGSGTTYTAGATFEITANTTLYAQWSINKHDITMPSNNAFGTYGLSYTYNSSTVTSATDVPYGVEITLNYTPAAGYENYVAAWSINGSFISGNTFTMLDEAVSVTVSVEENPFAYATLSSSDMQSMSEAGSGYGTLKTKTVDGFTWKTNGQQQKPSGSSTPYGMIQLRDRTNSSGVSYIELPSFPGKIETITFTVTNASATSVNGAACKAILCFQETAENNANIIVSGGDSDAGTKEITFDLTSVFYSTGFITVNYSSNAARIWNIEVKYRPYKNMSGTMITTIDADRTVSIPANTNATATDLTIPVSSGIIIRSGASLTVSGTLTNSGNEKNLIIEDGGQLITSNAVLATAKKNAAAASNWGDGEYTPDGWYFIASPLSANFNPVETSLLSNNYDLYYLNSENTKWMNYKQETFSLVNGTGYLYANDTDVTIEFAGEIVPYTTAGDAHKVTLTHDGWTLLGNPYTRKVSVDKAFVTLHNAAATTSNDAGSFIMPCRGFAVNGSVGDVITFTLPDESVAPNSGNIQIALAQTVANRGESNEQTIDNAIVSFNEGEVLPKFYFGTQNANIYIPQGDKEYAVVSAEPFGTIPVNFRAEKDGQYTLNIGVEEAEMNYLHLIDNMTGADVDLLVNPSYTFNARNNDYESRFKLVFSNSNTDEAEAQSDFAFISNGNLIVAGTGTLQIVDMMGRTIGSYSTSDLISTSDLALGVYVLRLVNGDNVKTQKIVVK